MPYGRCPRQQSCGSVWRMLRLTPPHSQPLNVIGIYNPCDDSAQRCEIYKYVDKHAKLCQAAVPICDGGCMLLTQL